MGFEPQKFFIGLTNFFSIILPGALLVYLGEDRLAHWIGASSVSRDSTEAILGLLVATYLLGHLPFLGSSELDEWVY